MVCPCCAGECCCVGTSLITLEADETTPTGETCFAISEDPCDGAGTGVNPPDPAESCTGATAVIEWCELSVTLECGVTTGEETDQQTSENYPFGFPPFLCTVDGADIMLIQLAASFTTSITNPGTFSRSDCPFGCFEECDRCVIRFNFILYDQPAIGAAKARNYYVTQRSGCDESPIIETVFDDGNYCCPEEAEITITFAP